MAEPFKQKQKSLERAESITGLAKEVLNKKKKPVKFTWKGFANLASGFLETNPFDKLKLDRIKELQEGAPEKKKDYIDFFEDLEKGLYGGVQDLGYAVGDLLTSGIDTAAAAAGINRIFVPILTASVNANLPTQPRQTEAARSNTQKAILDRVDV